MNISSINSLFHYTSSIENLKGILENGFKYNSSKETLPFKMYSKSIFSIPGLIEFIQEVELICFCDIPLNLASEHRSQYGSYCIGLSKEWGLKNGLTPVRYIHLESPDINNDVYRNLIFEPFLLQNYQNDPIIMFSNMLNDKTSANIDTNDLKNLPKNIHQLFGLINSKVHDHYSFIQYSIQFLKPYKGEWKDRISGNISERIFYDEREWRSVRQNNNNKYLPFDFNDVNYILVESLDEKDQIKNVFMNNKLAEKIITYKELNEDPSMYGALKDI